MSNYKFEIVDRVTELQHKARQTKVIYDSFTHRFVDPVKDVAIKAVQLEYDDYRYTASVVLELLCDVLKQIDDLEKAAQGE